MVEKPPTERLKVLKHLRRALWITVYIVYAGRVLYDLSSQDSDSFGLGVGLFMLLIMLPACVWFLVDTITDAIRSARDD
jgi:hypothetical protein